ncbi:Tetraspanin-3, partial [Ophiophagus hannah]
GKSSVERPTESSSHGLRTARRLLSPSGTSCCLSNFRGPPPRPPPFFSLPFWGKRPKGKMDFGVIVSKSVLLFISFIFWGAAAGLLYVGAHILNAYKEYDPFLQNRDALLPPIIIIAVAVVMLVIGIVGCCATLRESKIGLGVFLVIILLIFTAEMATFIMAEFHDSMSKAFAAYDGKSENSHSVDYLQNELQCCGIQNYTDWTGTKWFNTIGNHTFPRSCCKQGPTFNNCTGQLSEKHLLNTQGCEKIVDLRDLLNYAMLIVLAFAIVKFFGMLGICMLACKKERQGYQSLSTGWKWLNVRHVEIHSEVNIENIACLGLELGFSPKKSADQDPSLKTLLSKVVHEMFLLNSLLNKLEEEYHHQKRLQKQLKDMQESIERDYLEAQHLEENLPIYLPQAAQGSSIGGTLKEKEPCKAEENMPAKKSAKISKCIREAPFIMDKEFESVPSYMKGRLTCSQVNAVITEINKAVASKYSIMRQPLKSMADIEEFTQLKADKRFHSILTILRHCHRVREIRGSRLVRYAIC